MVFKRVGGWTSGRSLPLLPRDLKLYIFHLRTFAPIATAYRYYARKFTHHVMHRARALSNKMKNDTEDGHCWALHGFNDLGRSVTPKFFPETDFIYDLHIVHEWTKTERGRLKKNQDLCPREIESCHLATAMCVKLWSLNSNLFFKKPNQLTKFT